MSTSLRDVYEWHMENAKECAGRADLETQAVMHLDFAKALQPHLPPPPCGMCRGSGSQIISDSESYEVLPCDCQMP